MQTPHIRHKLNIHWHKIVVGLLLLVLGYSGTAQNNPTDNLPDYDEHFLHYGFLIGIHSSKYRIRYRDVFESPAYDTLHSIVPGNLPGFKLGFVVNFHLLENLDFRILPTVGFYESDLTYRYTNFTETRHIKDATLVEIPLLFKYKSHRRGNYGMYLVAGVKPTFEAVGRGQREDTSEKLDLLRNQISIEVGTGFDMYFKLFKFSPEIRYSYGIRNMLNKESNSSFNAPLKRVTTHNFTMYVTFEGGPSTISGNKGRRPNIKTGAPKRDKRKRVKIH